jgi:hypothetical protein
VVTLLTAEGAGAEGRQVRIDGVDARPCGPGCYRGHAGAGPLTVTVDGRRLRFDLPARAPDASDLLRQVTRSYRASTTIVFDERLASSPTNGTVTRFAVVAPDRLSYRTRGGPEAVVIGERRWDRDRPGARWLESDQSPLDVTQPYWRAATNVHLIAPNVVTFVDRRIPAWFRVTLAGMRPRRVAMTAASHFMVDRYVGFDGPVTVSPPSR